MDDVSHNDYSFTDITVTEAVKNQIPFIITNKISGMDITQEFDRSLTLLSLSYFENCEVITNIAKEMDKRIKYFIILHKACEIIVEDMLNELQFYEVKFFITDEDDGTFISLTITSEMNEDSCRYDGRIKKEKFKLCRNYFDRDKEIDESLQAPLDLKKCKFNVGMASLYPYSMIKNKEYLKTFDPLRVDDMNGSDVEIIKIIANYFNATLNLHYVDRNEENPYFDDEYLKFVINGSLDVCVGGLYKIYGDIVSYSGIYSSQAIVWVYTVERSTRSWQKLVGKTHGLYIFLIFYVLYSITWRIVTKFDGKAASITDTLLYSWGALVGATSLQDAGTVKQKILNILYLIMSLYLSTYVSCQIYSYLTIEEPPPHYKTVDELKSSDKTAYLVPVSKYFVQDKKHEAFANTSRDCINFNDCEVKLIKYNASSILIDGHLPLLQSRTAVNDEARVLRVTNEILTIYHEMIIRKYSPFVKSYQKVTQRLFESGICRKLYEAAIGITVVDRAKIANKNILSNSYSCTVGCKITLLQLAGTFYIWILGCSVSIFIFVMEIIVHREKAM
nr:uncharacterized protein LOC117991451 [Maniola hyperantus]